MLHQIVKYAEDHGLMAEPGFAVKQVRWSLAFDKQGEFRSVNLLDVENKKGRSIPGCPDFSFSEMKAGGVTKAHFLVESAEVVGLYGKKGDDAKVKAKHEYFLGLLEKAAEALPVLAAVARQLARPETLARVQELMQENKVKPTDKVTIQVGDDLVVEQDSWHDWWRGFRARLAPAGKQKGKGKGKKTAKQTLMRDLITGELVEPVKVHFKIKGLAGVGGQSSGDAFISFKQQSFRSFGLEQSLNSPVSEETMNTYVETLNALVREKSRHLAGALVVYWYQKDVPRDEDPLDFLENPEEEDPRAAERKEKRAELQVAKLLQAIRKGERPDLMDNHYFALTLNGAAGRVMVRDWMEGPFPELVENINAWFDHLAIVHRQGGVLAPPPKMMAVLGSTVRDLKELEPPFIARMWRVAVRGEPIPRSALARALRRATMNVMTDQAPRHAGLGLLKAYLIRKGDENMSAYLNEDHPQPAYHCGRLMAVYAQLQYSALGDVGAGVVQRYYASASATPALVLGRLARLGQFHLNKLEGGLPRWYEELLANIWSRLGDDIPKTLDLDGQTLFALGYYQQMANLRTKKQDQAD